ncbi:MAG: ABC transporter ATP-binding protein, partial [Anaerolineales bacterium]|nr:ABC transporter ATP-binding protein [Anaerolineales bacterium]
MGIARASIPIQFRKAGAWPILRRCMGYLRPYGALVSGSYALQLATNGISLALPLVIRSVIDQGIRGGDVPFIRIGTGILLLLTVVRGVFTFLSGRWTEVASQNVAYDMRNALHAKLQSLSFSYHDQVETGQLLVRAITDVDRIRFLTGRAFVRLAEIFTLILGIGVAMLLMNVRLALLTLSIMPFLVVAALNFGTRFRPMALASQQQVSDLTTRLEQNLRGALVVKAFGQEQAEIARFDGENRKLFDLNMLLARSRSVSLPLLNLIASVGSIFILFYGGMLVMRGQLTIGELVAFTAYVAQLLVPVRRLGMIVAAVAQAVASGERIFEILDAESEVRDLPDAQPLEQAEGRVRFEHVSFAYFGRHQVLKDIDFEAQPGDVVAVLGATGSGKSSVINLIPRFYDPTEGRILLDGHDIRHVTLESLRQHISVVLQDTTLFASSVRENIAFGLPDATDEDIVAAAQAASAHQFIVEMPDGYDTRVGEKGATLSGGQRQRIAIARALLKNPRILILDDATSSVDTETEALIQAALARLMEGRTSFVIAQRLSTVRRADMILLLEGGRIVAQARRTPERSAHEALLETSGFYAELYHRQLRHQETPPLER